MFDKQRAQRAAATAQSQQRQAAVQRLRQLAATLPDANGVVPLAGFQQFMQMVVDHQIALRDYPDIRDPILLGLAAGGNFLKRDTTTILKKGEAALWDEPAELLKEVTDREWRGGSRGVSMPIGMGMRYRVGQTRGHTVTLGTHWEAADSGVLTLTDQRVVYHGERKMIEFSFAKLASLNAYSDAVSLGVTNRQTTSTFRMGDGAFVAGMIRAALDHADSGVTVVRLG
jgi:hypothetical protein